jgi:hypothetical protein
MMDIQQQYEKSYNIKNVQKIYNETNVLPTTKVLLYMLWNSYDRFEIIKFFENKIPIDVDIINQIPYHSEHGHIASGFSHKTCYESLKILQYLYEKYHVACNNEGLLNACLCADLPSSKYIIETMNVIPNSTHIERMNQTKLLQIIKN